jgi:Leucine-rich repeat (LRR) protein
VLNINVKGTQPRVILNPSGGYPTGTTGTQGRARQIPRKHNRVKSGASTSSISLDLNDSEIISDSAQEGFRASSFFRFLEWIGTSIKTPSKIVLKNITFVQSLPIGFGELKSLRHLDLSSCTNLTELPKSFSELMHLQYLVLRDCIKLAIPIDFLGNMSSLEYVDFKGCCKLKYLPTGIENQRCLRYLNLLYTDLKWPLNIELPEKLQRLRIGNLRVKRLVGGSLHHHQALREHVQGTELRQSLGDLRPLKELKDLILIDFDGADGILWEEIAGPNMKVLVIRDCPISIFSFKEQRTMHIAMGALIDFTLTETRISEMCIPEGVLPSLETLDLSYNRALMQVKYLPSTLVRLNLQGCVRLKALINLSNLVDLKFLCISRCEELETLNVEGLTSLEEIQAEACRELKSIEGLSQLERLKYLRISTITGVIWNDICNFLTSTSHKKISTAFFSGKSTMTGWDTAFIEMVMREMQLITAKFNLKVVDVVFHATPDDFGFPADPDAYGRTPLEFDTKMEDFQSYGAILMCFLTSSDGLDLFHVSFEASNDGGSSDEYEFRTGYILEDEDGVKLRLHVLMWTEECNLFRDEKGYNNITVSCDSRPFAVKKGWIMMVDKNVDVSQVCKQIVIAWSC